MSELILDTITISISYVLFWLVIILLILYPKLSKRKVERRLNRLNKNQ
jgi:uncharacterized membrane protein YciS (DUF1049 family)